MDDSLKRLADVFKLASQFFHEAAELVTGYARREQILRKEPKIKTEERVEKVKDREINTDELKEGKKEKSEKKDLKRKEIDKGRVDKEKSKDREEDVESKEENKEKNDKKRDLKNKEKEKDKNSKKETGKAYSGYKLFLETKIKELKDVPSIKGLKANEYSRIISSLWEELSSSEKEIWSENAKELQDRSKEVEIIPKKNQRSSSPMNDTEGRDRYLDEDLGNKRKKLNT